MSSSESAPTPQKSDTSSSGQHRSDTSSSIPTDLTVSSSSSAGNGGLQAENRRLAQQVALLEIEARKMAAKSEIQLREQEARLVQAEQDRLEAVAARTLAENSVELRLAVQGRQMASIQAAVNSQLSEVVSRQGSLELTNLKLRERSDEAKRKLQGFVYSEEDYRQLVAARLEDMSLSEAAELTIYRNIIPEKKKNAELQLAVSELESGALKHSELLERLEDSLGAARGELARRQQEISEKESDMDDIRASVQELDCLNEALQQRLAGYEKEDNKEQAKSGRREEELVSYRRRQEQLQNDLRNTTLENRSLVEELSLVRREVEGLRGLCQGMGDRSEQGLSSLSQLTRTMQSRQMGLLEQLSSNVLQSNLDMKYREQYLGTIKELVTEQVRSQKYISRLTSEREEREREAARLKGEVSGLQMDLLELEVCRSKEGEKVTCLEGELLKLQKKHVPEKPIQEKATVEMTENRNVERMVPEKEYKSVVQDLELLLSHREEISQIREFVAQLQESTTRPQQ